MLVPVVWPLGAAFLVPTWKEWWVTVALLLVSPLSTQPSLPPPPRSGGSSAVNIHGVDC